MTRHLIAITTLIGAIAGFGQPAAGQSIFGRIKDKVKQAADAKSNQVTDSAISAVAGAIACAITDKACIQHAAAQGKSIKITDANGKPVSSADSAAAISAAVAQAAAAAQPELGDSGAPAASTAAQPAGGAEAAPPGSAMWLNYDFVPGDRTIFFEDFSGDNTGDFPHHLQLADGNFEVVVVNGVHYLRTAEGGNVVAILPEKLPARFTVEVHYFANQDNSELVFRTTDDDSYSSWWCTPDGGGVYGNGGRPSSSANASDIPSGTFVDCRFTIDGQYVKAYVNQHRVGNLPNGSVFRGDSLFLKIPGFGSEHPTLVTNIRVAAGGKPLYDALAASGRVATHGIYFASGSAQIQPESTPTLKEIGDMLKAHPDLNLTIEGHTDNVGSAAANQTLSEQRAAAVKTYLVSTLGIPATRLSTKGYGASKPVSPNTTAEGRQNNRRVELVKM